MKIPIGYCDLKGLSEVLFYFLINILLPPSYSYSCVYGSEGFKTFSSIPFLLEDASRGPKIEKINCPQGTSSFIENEKKLQIQDLFEKIKSIYKKELEEMSLEPELILIEDEFALFGSFFVETRKKGDPPQSICKLQSPLRHGSYPIHNVPRVWTYFGRVC